MLGSFLFNIEFHQNVIVSNMHFLYQISIACIHFLEMQYSLANSIIERRKFTILQSLVRDAI